MSIINVIGGGGVKPYKLTLLSQRSALAFTVPSNTDFVVRNFGATIPSNAVFVLCVSDYSQPGGATISDLGLWFRAGGQTIIPFVRSIGNFVSCSRTFIVPVVNKVCTSYNPGAVFNALIYVVGYITEESPNSEGMFFYGLYSDLQVLTAGVAVAFTDINVHLALNGIAIPPPGYPKYAGFYAAVHHSANRSVWFRANGSADAGVEYKFQAGDVAHELLFLPCSEDGVVEYKTDVGDALNIWVEGVVLKVPGGISDHVFTSQFIYIPTAVLANDDAFHDVPTSNFPGVNITRYGKASIFSLGNSPTHLHIAYFRPKGGTNVQQYLSHSLCGTSSMLCFTGNNGLVEYRSNADASPWAYIGGELILGR